MRMNKADIRKGMDMTGGPCPVTQLVMSRRDRIQKGMFMTGGPFFTRTAPAPRYGEGEPSPFAAVSERMDAMRVKLEALAATLRAANNKRG